MSGENTTLNVIPAEAINERFDRIEKKIDKLSDAMVSLARTEEKIMAMESDRSNMYDRLNRHSEKLDELNEKVNSNTRIVENITKVTWLIAGAIVAGFSKIFLGL